MNRIKEALEKNKINIEKIKENKKKFVNEKDHFYNNVLKYQSTIMEKTNVKESLFSLNKINLQ